MSQPDRPASNAQPLRIADSARRLRHVFVRDLTLEGRVGVYRHERTAAQRVRVNVDLTVAEGDRPTGDSLAEVVCYETVVRQVRALVESGHVNLVETLAERIAALCLEDRRVMAARIRVEKLDVFPDAASVGVEIERART